MTTATAKPSRIAHLQALIDHDRTPEHERMAAEAMLKRIMANRTQSTATEHGQYERFYGAKYDHTHSLSTVDIAKLIRAEIKISRKLAQQSGEAGEIKLVDAIGDAPEQIKLSIRSASFAGGSSIDIVVRDIPRDWGFEMRADRYGDVCEMPTDALRALADALKTVMDAYNHNGSDTMTDYWDVRFYGGVKTELGLILA